MKKIPDLTRPITLSTDPHLSGGIAELMELEYRKAIRRELVEELTRVFLDARRHQLVKALLQSPKTSVRVSPLVDLVLVLYGRRDLTVQAKRKRGRPEKWPQIILAMLLFDMKLEMLASHLNASNAAAILVTRAPWSTPETTAKGKAAATRREQRAATLLRQFKNAKRRIDQLADQIRFHEEWASRFDSHHEWREDARYVVETYQPVADTVRQRGQKKGD